MRPDITIPASTLQKAAQYVAPFALANKPRAVDVLKGVLFDLKGGALSIVALDRMSMSVLTSQTDLGGFADVRFVVPVKKLADLAITPDINVDLFVSAQHVATQNTRVVLDRLDVSHVYPNWRDTVLNITASGSLSFRTETMRAVITSLPPTDDQKIIIATRFDILDLRKPIICVSVESDAIGVDVPGVVKGHPATFKCNRVFLDKILAQFTTATIATGTPYSPLRITGDVDGIEYYLMPITGGR